VHVYLTAPFVLSWSLLEAMSCGCLIVASDTEPVKEVMGDARHGVLVDFRNPEHLAGRIAETLDAREALDWLRAAARARIVEQYAAERLVPRHLALIERLYARGRAASCAELRARVAQAGADLFSTGEREPLTTH
jgi:glycosyltransferase involved in cell wall biosynthesis